MISCSRIALRVLVLSACCNAQFSARPLESCEVIAKRQLQTTNPTAPHAIASVRSNAVDCELRRHNIGAAVKLMNRFAQENGPYPYGAATTLIFALSDPEEKKEVFQQALQALRSARPAIFGRTFEFMIAQLYEVFPPEDVISASEIALKQAKAADAKDDWEFQLWSTRAKAAFKSNYDYSAFMVLPALRQYAPARADDLLKHSKSLRALVLQFPNGLRSFNPTPPGATIYGGEVKVGILIMSRGRGLNEPWYSSNNPCGGDKTDCPAGPSYAPWDPPGHPGLRPIR